MAGIFENDKGVVNMGKKIRVCLLTKYSNERIHKQIPLCLNIGATLVAIKHHEIPRVVYDAPGVWNEYAIQELRKCEDVELHVVSPHSFLRKKIYDVFEDEVFFHFYKDIDGSPIRALISSLFAKKRQYRDNRRLIKSIIDRIQPDIIHLIGAENLPYSAGLLDVPQSIPTLVQLQTLINDPEFKNNYPISEYRYNICANYELEILKRADFIGTKATQFIDIIKRDLVSSAVVLNTTLPLTEPVNLSHCKKEFDFVYFAANISKAADWAIEAFILASKVHPGITLDIVGEYSEGMKEQLLSRLSEFNRSKYVSFEGKLPTHDDVINQIRKSRFAVIPMKIDLLTGTVRECMANGIPTVTTITPSSPNMNKKRQSLLLSEKGDFQAMADNMCRLLEDEQLAETIRQNAGVTASERAGNREVVLHWVEAYKAILDNKMNGAEIPNNLVG